MTLLDLKNITSQLDDVKPILERRNFLLTQTNRTRRQLKTKINEYSFLKDLVDIDSCGNKLVDAVVSLFKSIGFLQIENVDKKYKDEDIRLRTDNLLIIFEITGIDTPNPKDDKAHRISKHIPVRQREYPELTVFGLFVVNHDNKKHFTKREKKPFRKKIIEVANEHKYTLTTTVDLLNAFINIRKGILTKEDLIKNICSTGELKILGT